MKFNAEKKQSIVLYILEKIAQGTTGLSKAVSDTLAISQVTVHTYLNELLENQIIRKAKRGQYELVSQRYDYVLRRSRGELSSDTHGFDMCLKEHIAHLPSNVRQIWEYGFTEMVNNVMDHSEAENMYVSVVQNYLETYAVIRDDGVGIFEKIKNYFSFSSLDEAICELFKGKLTTDEANHSGEGIFFTSKMMDSFLIYSSGKIFAASKFYNESVISMEKNVSGTRVLMSLSNFSNKNAREVFDLYASVDGGFTKTRIPLKNLFDASPVSRSQAKRICNRLDQFEQVLLDFSEVSWMGQGFAHQLFVVYPKAHPQIELTPINMNEDVRKMYYHVIHSDG